MKIIAANRRAKHDYEIKETLIAGLVLTGTEVKSIRGNRVSIKGSYCMFKKGELYLRGATIPPYPAAKKNHEIDRDRKLLLTKKQLQKLRRRRQQGNYIIPLAIGLAGSYIKLKIGVGKSRKKHDKRERLRKKEDKRRAERAIKKSRF